MKNIVLIGMTGCGKSTAGRVLANHLQRIFIDLDDAVEIYAGETIPEMFAKGEAYFRDQESGITREVSKRSGQIIATGGGIVLRPENISALKEKGVIIFIDRPLEKIRQDIEIKGRPLLEASGKDHLDQMYADRYPLYQEYSDYQVVNNASFDDLLEDIARIITKIEGASNEN